MPLRHHFVPSRGYYEYRPKQGTCAGCNLRQFCTRDRNGRTLKRYAGQELLDKASSNPISPAARSDRKRRQCFQERNFAEATVQHGFKRSRWRGLWRQSIQDYLIAAIQTSGSSSEANPIISVPLAANCSWAFAHI
jgi:hypothetical protein